MDHRTPLKLHTVLAFDGMNCFVEEVIGQGSNAIVYKGWYPDQLNPDLRHHVLVKELFPFHPKQKIRRDDDDRITVEPEGEALWNTHKESFLAGNDVHLRLLADHPDMVGGNLNSFCANGTLYSILGYSGGRSLQTELNASGHDLRSHARLLLRLLDALEAFHKSGYLHLDISPDNIMLVGNGENERIFLIDFNSAHVIGSDDHAYLSRKPGYSAPEVETGARYDISFPSDLYSVAAVFYRCLMGRTLTLEETLRAKAPDGKDSSYLKDMPETVVSMVGRILKKGLHTLPGKRYQSIGQMRLAFAELIDRIDCVGVTHWSLWENGKRSVEELIRINPSLRYVKEANQLYPIRLKREESSISLSRYLADTLSPEGKSSLIVAQGGMGKTTLLLHTAMLHGRHYTPSTPAVFYISLNSWDGRDPHYIQNQILMSLRFKRDMNHYDSARHALQQLLNQPLKTRAGDISTVLLLLDGLNEIHGDAAVLIREINELSKLAGVRIIAASRNEIPALELQTAALIPLEIEDVESALSRNTLLIPRKQEALQLLRTPLILSIYIQASEAGKQLDIETEEELMRSYMDSLLHKELKQLPEDSPQKWQIDAALNYVLPAIAAEEKKKGHALTERQMLKVVEKCRKTLRSPLLRQVFPQWIGHSKDIFADAETADDWFGVITHTILHQRLGLLAKNDENRYRIFHQSVSDYLGDVYRSISKRIRLRQGIRFGFTAAIVAGMIIVLLQYIHPVKTYADEDIKQVMDWSAGSYVSYGNLYGSLHALTVSLTEGDTSAFEADYDYIIAQISTGDEQDASTRLYTQYIEEYIISEKNALVSWSGITFAGDLAIELMGYAAERMLYYEEILPSLHSWTQSTQAQSLYPDYPQQFINVLEADANVVSELYHQVCAVHMVSTDELWENSIRNLVAEVSGQEAHRNLGYVEDRKQYLENLRQTLQEAENQLSQHRAGVELASESDSSEQTTSSGGGWITLMLAKQRIRDQYLYTNTDIQDAIKYGTISCNAYIACHSAMEQLVLSTISEGESAYHAQYDAVYQTLTDYAKIEYATYQFLENNKPFLLSDDNELKVSWSYLPFNWELLERLIYTPVNRVDYYLTVLEEMCYWLDDPKGLNLMADVLDAEMAVIQELYWLTCSIHLDGSNPELEREMKDLQENVPLYEYTRAYTILDLNTDALQKLDADLAEAESALAAYTFDYLLSAIGDQISDEIANSAIKLS